jgi:tetratricopeptide (TPR) repeat protein
MSEAASATKQKVHFFISRAGADKDFATALGRILEDAGYRVILQDWDFADKNFIGCMHDALIKAERVILLLSPEYLASHYCSAEWMNAMAGDPLNRSGRLIIFRVKKCEPTGLLAGLAYRDLLPLRDHATRLRDYILEVVNKDRPRTAHDGFFIPARTVLHDRIREVPNFTGRREDLAALDRALWTGKTAVITQAAVQGLGGVGKSTLAIQYAWEDRERYAGAWWLGADTPSGIVDGLVALGAIFIPGLNEAKDRGEAARTALNFIAHGGFEKPWLLLYDNVEQPKALDGLLPRVGAHALITTRFPDWKGRAAAVPLGVFAEHEAVQFLLDRTDRTDKEGAARLAADLGHLPLALDHGAAYCKRTGTSFDKYRELLPELIKRAPKDADYPRNVYATFSLAIKHAAADCPEAEKLMGIFAYFGPDDIPLSLITANVMSEIARGEAVAALCEVSLLEVENDGDQATVSVHRLAQTVMRDRLAKQGKGVEASALALSLAKEAFPYLDGPSDVGRWAECSRLRSHALAVLAFVRETADQTTTILLQNLAAYLYGCADYSGAEALLREALEIAEKAYGPDHPKIATSLNNLAELLRCTNRLANAEGLMRRALAIDEQSFGPDHPEVAICLNNLAAILQATNRLAEAEPLIRRALAIDEKSFGPDHPNVAIRLGNLAGLLIATSRIAEAEHLRRRELAIMEKVLPPDHPYIAIALNNLSVLLQATNRLAEAEPLIRRALAIDEKSFGPNHPNVARDLNNLAQLLKDTTGSKTLSP